MDLWLNWMNWQKGDSGGFYNHDLLGWGLLKNDICNHTFLCLSSLNAFSQTKKKYQYLFDIVLFGHVMATNSNVFWSAFMTNTQQQKLYMVFIQFFT